MHQKKLSVIFFGTPALALPVLEALQGTPYEPSLIVSAPARPAGRKLTLTQPPVAEWAEKNTLALFQPETLKTPEEVPEIANTEWDVAIVVAYGLIIPSWLLSLPKHGTINIHPSLLPFLRGPSPIRSALLLNLPEAVGVSVMLLDEKVDHGPLLGQARVELPVWPLPGNTLDKILFKEGAELLLEVLPLWCAGTLTPETQDHTKATYSKKFTKEDGLLDLQGDAFKNYCTYCALEGWPGTYFFTEKEGKRVRMKIVQARYEQNTFVIERVIPEGGKEMEWKTK